MITKYFVKSIIFSRRVWIFGILFGIFLLYIGYNQSISGIGLSRFYQENYTAEWTGLVILFLLGTISTTIAQVAIYSSSSLPYLFKFSRLSRRSYLYNITISSLVVGICLSAVISIVATLMFSYKFGFIVHSNNYLSTYFTILLGSLFMIFFALFLVLLVINYLGARTVNYIQLLPMLLTYGIGILLLTANITDQYIYYVVPFNAYIVMFQEAFDGKELQIVSAHMHIVFSSLQYPYLLLSLLIWIASLIILDILLLGRIKASSLEERSQI